MNTLYADGRKRETRLICLMNNLSKRQVTGYESGKLRLEGELWEFQVLRENLSSENSLEVHKCIFGTKNVLSSFYNSP